MTPRNWLEIGGISLLALLIEAFTVFGLAFNPGWANGWPFGLTIDSVWSAGLSFWFFMILMTVAVGLGALSLAACTHFGFAHQHGRWIYACWLACCCVLALLVSLLVFREVQEGARELWPNGYHP
jgi:hypothetical protein